MHRDGPGPGGPHLSSPGDAEAAVPPSQPEQGAAPGGPPPQQQQPHEQRAQEGEEASSGGAAYWRKVRRHAVLLCVFVGSMLLSYSVASVVVPVLPKRLAAMGASPLMQGCIFSAYPVAILLASPLVPSLVRAFGRVAVLLGGFALGGGLEIAFGYVDAATGGARDPTLYAFIAIRLLQGCAEAASSVAVLGLISEYCKDIIGLAVGLIESSAGVGYVIGPVVGGVLYDAFGFRAPFVCVGVTILVCVPLVGLVVRSQTQGRPAEREPLLAHGPPPEEGQREPEDPAPASLTLRDLCNRQTLHAIRNTLMTSVVFSFVNPVITLHFEDALKLSTGGAAAVFAVIPVMYAVCAPVAGWLGDTRGPRPVILGGVALITVSYALVGPLPPAKQLLGDALAPGAPLQWAFQVASGTLFGIGAAFAFVPTLPLMQAGVEHLGGGDVDDQLNAVFNSVYYFGEAAGPLVGTFSCASLGFASATFIVAVVLAAYLAFELSLGACYHRRA